MKTARYDWWQTNRWHPLVAGIVACVITACGGVGLAVEAEHLPVDRLVGQRVADFTLPDVQTDTPFQLYSLAARNTAISKALGLKSAQAVVLAFITPGCPLGEKYLPRLGELAATYDDRGVWFIGIASNAGDTRAELKAWADERQPGFPILHDDANVLADALLVERCNEVVVLDARARIRYRGAIDDQYGYDETRAAPRSTWLADALDAVLAGGKSIPVAATPVAGCRLTKVEPAARGGEGERIRAVLPEIAAYLDAQEPAADVGPVDYAHDVAPILQQRCQACHRPGQVGGFSLLTAADARSHSAMIAEVVASRRMPPWHADPRHGVFANDRRLTGTERATILAWAAQGCPPGDAAAEPPAREWPEGWTIGTPDRIFEIPEAITIPAQGTLPYVNVSVPTNFTEDVWVQAAEARPGDHAVVHHIIVFVEPPEGRRGRRLGQDQGHLCGYAPGDMPSRFPPGSAKLIPAGSRLKFQLHYTPNGRVTTDRSQVGFILAPEPPRREAKTIGIANTSFIIPPHAADHAVRSRHVFDHETRLLAFMPHMHLRGKAFRYTLQVPGTPPEVLLDVPAYDFGWQSYYALAEPRILPAGAAIVCDALFDNSAANAANPDPSLAVRWGEQTWEEMMIGYVDVDEARAE